jgi:hypothetical protein
MRSSLLALLDRLCWLVEGIGLKVDAASRDQVIGQFENYGTGETSSDRYSIRYKPSNLSGSI